MMYENDPVSPVSPVSPHPEIPDLVIRDVLTHLGISLDAINEGDVMFTGITLEDRYVLTVLDATKSGDVEVVTVIQVDGDHGTLRIISQTDW